MGTNGLLAVFAILLAWYTLLTDEKRTDFKLRMSFYNVFFIVSLFLIVMTIVYSPVLLSILNIKPIPWLFGFTEDTLAFTCLCLVIAFFGFKVLGRKIPQANYTQWGNISEQYLRAKKFEQLGYLLDKYHAQLFNVIDNKKWYVRVHDYLYPRPQLVLLNKKPKSLFDNSFFKTTRKILAKPFSHPDQSQEIIQLNISRLLKSKAFVSYLSDTYPHVAMKATCIRFRDSSEYVTSYFTYLISQPGSILYRELRDNQNCSYTGEYFLDESNLLLNFYFNDIDVAKNIGIWKPIGDYVEKFIKEQKGEANYYNQKDDYFSASDERWGCPIFVGLMFFNVMISLSIFKRSKYHMWLMYYLSFLRSILEKHEYSSNIDRTTEFPIRFDYLIYELIHNCSGWVGAIEHLDYTACPQENMTHSPEYFASKCLGEMMHLIIESEKLDTRQKSYLLEMVIQRMYSLDQNKHNFYSKIIFDGLVRTHEGGAVNIDTVNKLRHVYKSVDHVHRHGHSTFETELAKL
jgi:hypothetical protein